MFLGITLQDSKTSSVLNGHIYWFCGAVDDLLYNCGANPVVI